MAQNHDSQQRTIPHHDPVNPFRFTSDLVCGAGISSIVWKPAVVFKGPFSEKETKIAMIEREKQVYERLASPGHEGIIRYYGQFECFLVLGYAQHGSIRSAYKSKGSTFFTTETKLRWAEEIAEALAYIHSHSVLHCDISCNNIFLDHEWAVKIGDFAGSCIDGSPELVYYEASHSTPEVGDVSIQSELFALGSTLYEIFSGEKPFAELDEYAIEERFASDSYPDLTHLPACKDVINNCWHRHYQSVTDLLRDIKKARSDCRDLESYRAPISQSVTLFIAEYRPKHLTIAFWCGTVAAVTGVFILQRLRGFSWR